MKLKPEDYLIAYFESLRGRLVESIAFIDRAIKDIRRKFGDCNRK